MCMCVCVCVWVCVHSTLCSWLSCTCPWKTPAHVNLCNMPGYRDSRKYMWYACVHIYSAPTRIEYTYKAMITGVSHGQVCKSDRYKYIGSISYDSFHGKYYIPEIHHIKILRFVYISRYKFKLRFWLNLNLYRGIWVSRFGGFCGCSIFSGICHSWPPHTCRWITSATLYRYQEISRLYRFQEQ